jgi:hypothetical protein
MYQPRIKTKIQKVAFITQLPVYNKNILLQDLKENIGREHTFKLTFGNESLHEINNDNGVIRVVNFAM